MGVAGMSNRTALRLESRWIGGLPLINWVLEQLGLVELLRRYVPATEREKLAGAVTLSVLVRNLALCHDALYAQEDWVHRCEPTLLGLTAEEAAAMNDTRLGRVLDRLYDADRATLLTEIVLRAVRAFGIKTEELHNDSTTITFSGRYRRATGRIVRGRRALRVVRGFNKDHRPDLKQLVWQLTVSADGAVPVHYRVWDGNTADVTTHQDTWRELVKLVGHTDFLYVADSKLCNSETMLAIAAEDGRFITVMPRNRKEHHAFRDWIQSHEPNWTEISRSEPRSSGVPDIWRGFESPVRSAEGFRILWVWNSGKALEDAEARQEAIDRARTNLEALQQRLSGPRCRIKSRKALDEQISAALGPHGARWMCLEVEQVQTEQRHKQGRGRPGPNSTYTITVQESWHLKWDVNVAAVKAAARLDGMFPLMTNDDKLTIAEVLTKYKYQPFLEKRHEHLKTVQQVAPVCLKNESRIEALLFLHFVALLAKALLERALRQAMKKHGIAELAVYPEERVCRAPSAQRILALFGNLQRHYLYEDGSLRGTFGPEVSPLQAQILALLGLDQKDLAQELPL